MSHLQRAHCLATGIQKLRTILNDDLVKHFCLLQNNPLGFMTDKSEGYPVHVVRECIMQATLIGLYCVNNEFNIITGRMYAAKNGLKRLVTTYPGITDFKYEIGIPTMSSEKGAVVPCFSEWKINGIHDQMTTQIPVRVNAAMGIDAILGKATRKLYARIYERITGSELTIPDEPENEIQNNQAGAAPKTVADAAAEIAKNSTFFDLKEPVANVSAGQQAQ